MRLCRRLLGKDGFYGSDECVDLIRGAEGNAEVFVQSIIGEPTHEDFAVAQLLQPFTSGKSKRPNQQEVSFAGKNFEAEVDQSFAQLSATSDDFSKVIAVIRQIIKGGQSSDLAKPIDIVTVAEFVQGSDQFAGADKIADALKAE